MKEENLFAIPVVDILFTEKCNMNCKYCFERKKSDKSIDPNVLENYIKNRLNVGIFGFGGEPLIELDNIIKLHDVIADLDILDERKNKLLRNVKKIITNGTLIAKNVNKLKGYNLQISLDGPKEVHDLNRVFINESGTFDIIMNAIELCNENQIDWSIHGVINKQTIGHIADVLMFMTNLFFKYKTIDSTINIMNNNLFQIIFEEDYTDEDVEIVLDQFMKFCEMIWKDIRLSLKQKKDLLRNLLTHKGGTCSVGTTLFAINSNMDIYPCHRLVSMEKHKLGNVFDITEFKNMEIYNSIFRQRFVKKIVYSHKLILNGGKIPNWFNWCPATNMEMTNSIYYQNPKYSLLHLELNRLIGLLMKKYELEKQNGEICKKG